MSGMPEQSPMLPGGAPMGGYPAGAAPKQNKNGGKGATWRTVMFAMAIIICLGSGIGLFDMITSLMIFAPFDLVMLIFQLMFGLLLLSLDCPFPSPYLETLKIYCYKYLLFLTRFIGRGITYIFLGSMLWSSLWDSGLSPFIGFIFGFTVTACGIGAIYIGARTTRRLSQVKKVLIERGGPAPSVCPPQGLRMDKFAELAYKLTGIRFSDDELGYIANALSPTYHADDVISRQEFETWLEEPTFVLL